MKNKKKNITLIKNKSDGFSNDIILNNYHEFLNKNNITDCLLNTFNKVNIDKWRKVIYTEEDYRDYIIDEIDNPEYCCYYTFTDDKLEHTLIFEYIYRPKNCNVKSSSVTINNDKMFYHHSDNSYGTGHYSYLINYDKYWIPMFIDNKNKCTTLLEDLSKYLYIEY